MSKIPGFDFDYDCISDGEAYQRNHEYGDNYIDVKSLKEVGDIKRLIGSHAKVFRSNVVKQIEIDKITIGDFVIIEKGDIVPADAVVIESRGLAVLSLVDNKVIEEDLTNKEVYQGMKVLNGTATIMVAKIGKNTFIGKMLVELLENNKKVTFKEKLIKSFVTFGIICAVLTLVILIFGLIRFWGKTDFYKSFLYAGSFFVALMPVELVFMVALNICEIKKRLKNNGIDVKDAFSLVELDNIKVICVYDSFFNNKNVNDMQRLYRAGIRVIMLSNKTTEAAKKIAVESGLSANENIKVLTANEVKAMGPEELRRNVLEVIAFSEMDSEANTLVIKALESMGVQLVATGLKIEDSLIFKLANMGICVGAKRDNLESRLANAFVKTQDIKTILEMLRIARKFNDSLKKSIRYVIATRVPVFLLTLIAIIVNNGVYINPLYLIGVYWFLNTLFVWLLGTTNGNELILNVEVKKNIFTVKDTLLLALKTFVFSAILVVAYFLLHYFEVEKWIINYALISIAALGCLVIALIGKNKVKEKVIKPKAAKMKVEKPVKEKKTKEKVVVPKTPQAPPPAPEKPWVSDEKKEENNNKAKPNNKNKKQQRADELKGKML